MKTASIDHIAKPGSDKHQIEDLPEISMKAARITHTQRIRAIADFTQALYDQVYDLAASVLKVFPWLFIFYLLLPIYTTNERLAQMFSEQGVTLVFSDLAQKWIGTSFQFALMTGLCLALLRFIRNRGIFLQQAGTYTKGQTS